MPKDDQIIWWLMITFASIVIFGGGAWATNINSKVDVNTTKINKVEVNVQYIKEDISDIKSLIKSALYNNR